jgi:hypothetical protein
MLQILMSINFTCLALYSLDLQLQPQGTSWLLLLVFPGQAHLHIVELAEFIVIVAADGYSFSRWVLSQHGGGFICAQQQNLHWSAV